MYEILGYSGKLALRPGEKLEVKVSCEAGADSFRADIVRLICGDESPDGPGYKEEPVPASCNGDYPGRRQAIDCGSYVLIDPHPALASLESFAFTAHIWPTLPGVGDQTIAALWDAAQAAGFRIGLDAKGALAVWIGAAGQRVWQYATDQPFRRRQWYRLFVNFDAKTRQLRLAQQSLSGLARDPSSTVGLATAPLRLETSARAPLTFGAYLTNLPGERRMSAGHFNGKIEAPRLSALALTDAEMAALLDRPGPPAAPLLGAWDFARDLATTRVVDLGPHRLEGRAVNLPTRAVTGHLWDGSVADWRLRPDHYAAIHFHEDDLYDCAWENDFVWEIPADLKSGLYAVRLRCKPKAGGSGEDYAPFFVLPPKGKATAPVAYLASTATYMAYANSHHGYEDPLCEVCYGGVLTLSPTDLFLMRRRDFGVSTYDRHRDGSGGVFSSRLRPILNMRPKRRLWNYGADFHIVDWLEAIGHPYDVIDDETLHREGLALLESYRCVVTGTHPEYHSSEMFAALAAYRDRGGRLIYLGGNGFYWRIGFHPELPGAIEMRRGESGTRTWEFEPGELHLASTGEASGLWRYNGTAAQKLVGVGYASEGFDVGSYYRRKPDSFDPRVAFIFDGVAAEEKIGDFGPMGGAAALELDIVDPRYGTPPHTLVLAASENHSNVYVLTQEALISNYPGTDGIENPDVRADMVFFETANGGAVFSTGSIGWAACLYHNGYDNNVARITGNVLRRFIDPRPF